VTETEIIEGCVQKNVNCQQALFNKYGGVLMSICLRYAADTAEAEDMLQDTFIKIFSVIRKFRFEGSFEGWLKKIAVTTSLKKLQQKKIQFKELSFEKQDAPAEPEIISMLAEKEIIRAISSLPDGYRVVFNLYVLDGFSHDEIGGMLGIQPVTSRSQLLKARKMLQKKLGSFHKIPSK
jgi:RNA polymerase sigma-70 factor (ECF subfamily)